MSKHSSKAISRATALLIAAFLAFISNTITADTFQQGQHIEPASRLAPECRWHVQFHVWIHE